jgi:hypothetical protein
MELLAVQIRHLLQIEQVQLVQLELQIEQVQLVQLELQIEQVLLLRLELQTGQALLPQGHQTQTQVLPEL